MFRHAIAFNEAGVRKLMTLYGSYYENARTHRALDKDAPIPRPVMPPGEGDIVAIQEVGGLHHRYERRAAQSRRPLAAPEPRRDCQALSATTKAHQPLAWAPRPAGTLGAAPAITTFRGDERDAVGICQSAQRIGCGPAQLAAA